MYTLFTKQQCSRGYKISVPWPIPIPYLQKTYGNYCNMVEWTWWDSSLIWTTNWFPSVLWHCWFGHMTC